MLVDETSSLRHKWTHVSESIRWTKLRYDLSFVALLLSSVWHLVSPLRSNRDCCFVMRQPGDVTTNSSCGFHLTIILRLHCAVTMIVAFWRSQQMNQHFEILLRNHHERWFVTSHLMASFLCQLETCQKFTIIMTSQ